ncbi:MAG: GDSL-type esterase/lipase family protein [Candidatus Krumholzibacteria bacterium]|nr:GDSL-type esterase/lipase family protein [Candidatus Krumholzibacteria bacterium]MDP6669365.1 GDSL-type esterase/lipase family protein [Candidatus Krumholzibacteria bacterium]MDP6796736.1 GDSL-type esterase/lipase family protein [Candidatus Krumholzibacteria bacterium]MDP7022363.1 GDSL-type esterase/lipase family protein [Candidatus Krumholzibacteria bacterium]
MKPLAPLLLALLLVSSASASSPVDPADPHLLYTGRWDDSNASEPWCYWMGSSIIAHFEGSSLAITCSGGWWSNYDYLRVIIDDDAANSSKIAIGTSMATHVLATGLGDSSHKVEIIKETDMGYWLVEGFELDDGKSLLAPPERPSRRIEFYGDSNLAGYSLEHEENHSGYHLRGTYRGYAGIVSRMLDAEYTNVCRSGDRIAEIHSVFDQVDYWSPTPLWDFARFPPDLVVVGLGANDLGRPKVAIKSDYHDFLDDLRSTHPEAHIMLYNGWGWDYNEPANYTHEVIEERDDPNMSFAIFPWIFEQWHGCEYDHAGMAQILADHVSELLGWEQGPRDVMNGYSLGGNVANGGFEEVAPFGGYGWRYHAHPGVDRIHDPAGARDGEYYLRLSSGAATHQPVPASDGDTFTLEAWVRGSGNIAATQDFRDQKMWTNPLQSSTEVFPLTEEWQVISMSATAPLGVSFPVYHMRLSFIVGTGDTADIDLVSTSLATAAPGKPASSLNLAVWPNPFNPLAELRFDLPDDGRMKLEILDVSGRLISTLLSGPMARGSHSCSWKGLDERGSAMASGLYLARLSFGTQVESKRLLLIR